MSSDHSWTLGRLKSDIGSASCWQAVVGLLNAFADYHQSEDSFDDSDNRHQALQELASTDFLLRFLGEEPPEGLGIPDPEWEYGRERVHCLLQMAATRAFLAGAEKIYERDDSPPQLNFPTARAILAFYRNQFDDCGLPKEPKDSSIRMIGDKRRFDDLKEDILGLATREDVLRDENLRLLVGEVLYCAGDWHRLHYTLHPIVEAAPIALRHLRALFEHHLAAPGGPDLSKEERQQGLASDSPLVQILRCIERKWEMPNTCAYLRSCMTTEQGRRLLQEAGAKLEAE